MDASETAETVPKQEVEHYPEHYEKGVPVIEIFGPTIQGEGAMIGVKTMFLRMGGCDFRCKKCDSLHAVIPAAVKRNATWMKQHEILQTLAEKMHETGTEWVTISGGNPAMWDLFPVVAGLKALNFKVAVETQGTLWRDWLQEVTHLTISPKGPGMGEKFNEAVFTKFLDPIVNSYNRMMGHLAVSVKVVVFDQQDLEFATLIDRVLDGHGDRVGSSMGGPSPWWPREHRFLSLGNPFPPVLNEKLELVDSEELITHREMANLPETLLADYRNLLEMDYLNDARLSHWKFLPQLHVLVWSNKAGV